MSSTSEDTRAGTGRPGRGVTRPPKHVHDGKTPAAWVGAMLGLLAFVVGGIAVVLGPNWPLFFVACGLAVVSLVASAVLRTLGHGAV